MKLDSKKYIFVFEGIAVVLFLLGLVLVFEILYSNTKTRIDELYSVIHDSSDSVEVAIIGNSHAGAIGTPSLLGIKESKVGNYSVGGQDLFHASLVINEVVGTKKNLKYLILFVDYDLMGYSLISTNQRYTDREYYNYADTMQDMSLANRIMAKSNFFRNNRDLSILRNVFSLSKKKETYVDRRNDYIPIATKNDQLDLCEKRAKEMTCVKFNLDLIDENAILLKQICREVLDNSISLLVIVPPKRTCFYVYAHKGNTSKGKDMLYKTVLQYPNVKFIDLYNSSEFTDEDFIDPDHLNIKGVKKLSEIVSYYDKN